MDIRKFTYALPVSFLACATLLAAGVSCAQTTDASEIPRFSLTPFGGYMFGGEFRDDEAMLSVDLDDAAHLGLIFDIREGANTQWEIFYSRQQTDADTSGVVPTQPVTDIDIHYLQLGGTYVADGERARPFLAATLGVTRFDPDPLAFDSENFFSFGIGAGWYLQASERLNFRLEARALGTLLRSDSSLFCRTGPDENICALIADGDFFWQFQTSLGVAFRF
jgi:opacity protein-like surface antigen